MNKLKISPWWWLCLWSEDGFMSVWQLKSQSVPAEKVFLSAQRQKLSFVYHQLRVTFRVAAPQMCLALRFLQILYIRFLWSHNCACLFISTLTEGIEVISTGVWWFLSNSVIKKYIKSPLAMLTPWLPWQQWTGGLEGVCMSEDTVPIKWTKQKQLMIWAWKNFAQDEGNDVMNKCVLASGSAAPLSSCNGWWNPSQGQQVGGCSTLRRNAVSQPANHPAP